MRKHILVWLCILTGCAFCIGAESADSVTVRFRQSHTNLDPAFCDNATRLDSVFRIITPQPGHGRQRTLRHVRVIGAASPEGSVRFNRYLSDARATVLLELFRSRGLVTDSTAVSATYLGRDWTGLRTRIMTDSLVPYRDDVVQLLNEIVDSYSDGEPTLTHPLARLKALHGGIPYRYMYSRIFPDLRMSHLVIEYDNPLLRLMSDCSGLPPVNVAATPVMPDALVPLKVAKERRPFYMGIKTNLIYDALLIPNIGAEFYIGRGWSLTADWMYGWWDKDSSHRYWRAYGGTLGARRWFGHKAAAKPLTGHHAGVFAGVVTYDFEFGGVGYMGGRPRGTLWDRCNFICGLEYGYSLPIRRRLNIDFTVGFGYLGGKYYEYEPNNGFYVWKSTHRLNWVGPVKAEVSLVWLVGHGNYNRKKGEWR